MDHPKPWLRYVDASAVRDTTVDLLTMPVTNDKAEDLGIVKGLVVDADSGRPLYVTVSPGRWFTKRQFLVPIGEVHRSADRHALRVSLSREQIQRFPGFDTNEFERLGDDDILRVNRSIAEVFDDGLQDIEVLRPPNVWDRFTYRLPEWWTGNEV